jgi:hypothetical protein
MGGTARVLDAPAAEVGQTRRENKSTARALAIIGPSVGSSAIRRPASVVRVGMPTRICGGMPTLWRHETIRKSSWEDASPKDEVLIRFSVAEAQCSYISSTLITACVSLPSKDNLRSSRLQDGGGGGTSANHTPSIVANATASC